MTSFIDRLKARMANPSAATYTPPPSFQRHREVIKANRWDKKTYAEVRKTEMVDGFIEDLMEGDEFKGGTRKEFEGAPELVEGLFHSFHKAVPQFAHKRELERDLYPVLKILKEVGDNPKLKELQDLTVNDTVMSTIAIDAMQDTIKEIVGRIPPPPPPPGPGGGKGGEKGEKGEDDGQGGCGGGGSSPGQPGDQEGDQEVARAALPASLTAANSARARVTPTPTTSMGRRTSSTRTGRTPRTRPRPTGRPSTTTS